MIGNGKVLIRCFMLALFALLTVVVTPAAAQNFVANDANCAPYRGTTLPNACAVGSVYERMYRNLDQPRRDALRNNPAFVRSFYTGNTASLTRNVEDCNRDEQDRIVACKAMPATAADNARVDALLRPIAERDRDPAITSDIARREAEALRTAEAAAALAAANRNNTGAGGTGSAGGSSTTTIGQGPDAARPGCELNTSNSIDQGVALGLARAATIFDRTIMNVSARAAIQAAMCIDKLMDKINEVTTAFNAISGSLNNPLIAILVGIASQLLGQIITQMIDNVMRAVCNAADDIYQAIDNRLKNALCIKGDASGFNPLDFKIDIEAMRCSGWSIDLLTGNVLGQPIPGANVNWNGVRDAGVQAADPLIQYSRQQAAINNNTSLNAAQRAQQLQQLCRNYGRTDCGG